MTALHAAAAASADSPDSRCVVRCFPPAGGQGSLDRLIALCVSPGIRFVAVVGALGSGRSTLLSTARDTLLDRGIAARTVRLAQRTRPRTHNAANRLLDTMVSLTRDRSLGGRPVLLIDDLQAVDPESAFALEHLARMARQRSIVAVGGIRTPLGRTPLTGSAAWWRHGLADHSHATIRLGPLSRAALEELVSAKLGVAPGPEVSGRLMRLTAGVPAAVQAALDGWTGTDFLAGAGSEMPAEDSQALVLARDNALVRSLHELETPLWQVLTAAAVLHATGDRMPAIIAEATGRPVGDVLRSLSELADAGLLRRPGSDGNWGFRPPILAAAARSSLGPYQRASLSALAVTAMTATATSAADIDLLAGYVRNAVELPDMWRASRKLIKHVRTICATDPQRAARLSEVAARTAHSATRAAALRLNARASMLINDLSMAANSAYVALSHYRAHHTSQHIDELELIRLLCAKALRQHDELTAATHRVTDAAGLHALALLGDWPKVMSLAAETTTRETQARRLIKQTASVLAGQPSGIDWLNADGRPRRPSLTELTLTAGRLPLFLFLGDWGRAAELLRRFEGDVPLIKTLASIVEPGRPWNELRHIVGDEAAIAAPAAAGLAEAILVREAATVYLGTGWLNRAGRLMHATSAIATVVLSPVRADLAELVGRPGEATAIVMHGLAAADTAGIVAGTDELLFRMVRYTHDRGEVAEAVAWLDRLEAVATRMRTTRALLNVSKGRYHVHRSPRNAAEVIRLTQQTGRPYDLIRSSTFLAEHDHVSAQHVLEAYRLAGELHAPLWRARLRKVMRRNGITVADRRHSTEEADDLLGTMVAEALSNREIAQVLGVTGKSVENSLWRMCQRHGYRSRVDIASAYLRIQE